MMQFIVVNATESPESGAHLVREGLSGETFFYHGVRQVRINAPVGAVVLEPSVVLEDGVDLTMFHVLAHGDMTVLWPRETHVPRFLSWTSGGMLCQHTFRAAYGLRVSAPTPAPVLQRYNRMQQTITSHWAKKGAY